MSPGQRRPSERRRQEAGVSGEGEAWRLGAVVVRACSRPRLRGRRGGLAGHVAVKAGPLPTPTRARVWLLTPRSPWTLCRGGPHPPPFLPRGGAAPCWKHPVFWAASPPQEPGNGGARRRAEREGAGTRRGPRDSALRDSRPLSACTGSTAGLARVTSGRPQCLRGRAPGESGVETVLGEARGALGHLTASLGGVPGVPSVRDRDVHGPPSPLTCFPKSVAGSAQCHLHYLTGHPARPSVYRLSDSWLV